eukprot:c13816_g1_i1 orf=410-1264(-)
MSWQMLDGPSRRPRVSWAIPEHLRENSRYGPFRRPSVPAPLDPDVLLQYIDNAIIITENAQATRHLSLLFASSASSTSSSSVPASSSSSSSVPTSSSSSLMPSLLSSSSVSHTIRHHDDSSSTMLPLPSARKMSRFKSAPPQQRDEVIPASRPNLRPASKNMEAWPLEEQRSSKIDGLTLSLPQKTESKELSGVEGVSMGDDKSDKGEEYDARAADEAYRAACCAFSEGNADLALSLLHVASAKCPPNKHSALGKVNRLMAAAMQLRDKRSAALSPFPVDKDVQ